jgi:hypothetical protein
MSETPLSLALRVSVLLDTNPKRKRGSFLSTASLFAQISFTLRLKSSLEEIFAACASLRYRRVFQPEQRRGWAFLRDCRIACAGIAAAKESTALVPASDAAFLCCRGAGIPVRQSTSFRHQLFPNAKAPGDGRRGPFASNRCRACGTYFSCCFFFSSGGVM